MYNIYLQIFNNEISNMSNMSKKKRKPKARQDVTRDIRIFVRITPGFKEKIDKHLIKKNISVGAYIRDLMSKDLNYDEGIDRRPNVLRQSVKEQYIKVK